MIKTGCDILAGESCIRLEGKKAGLLVNPASVSGSLIHTANILRRSSVDLTCIFGPQHGLRGDTQANMVEWEGYTHPEFNIPVYSLYGKTREPADGMLEELDIVVIDLPDIGARPYTYLWTAVLMMRACARTGVEVLVLDRPNPIGGEQVEGPLLNRQYFSFVGIHPLPMRHGLTIGEALMMVNKADVSPCRLEVVRLEGWKRDMYFHRTGLPWVMPSPNIPTPGTAMVYPGMVLLETTNISEGRGTTQPFEIAGAPWIAPRQLVSTLAEHRIAGVTFRPLEFTPTWDKYAGSLCGGIQLHITDIDTFRPVRCAAILIDTISSLYPDRFEWLPPPYEYEEKSMPADIISGGSRLREVIDSSERIETLFESWETEENRFRTDRKRYLLY